MSTRTRTTTTHYHVQKKRRAEFIEQWRSYRQTVIRREDVVLRVGRAVEVALPEARRRPSL